MNLKYTSNLPICIRCKEKSTGRGDECTLRGIMAADGRTADRISPVREDPGTPGGRQRDGEREDGRGDRQGDHHGAGIPGRGMESEGKGTENVTTMNGTPIQRSRRRTFVRFRKNSMMVGMFSPEASQWPQKRLPGVASLRHEGQCFMIGLSSWIRMVADEHQKSGSPFPVKYIPAGRGFWDYISVRSPEKLRGPGVE